LGYEIRINIHNIILYVIYISLKIIPNMK
jgi:hypothetical protein